MRSMLIPVAAIALMGASDEAAVELPKSDGPALSQDYEAQIKALIERDSTAGLAEGLALKGLTRSNCLDRLERAQDDAGEGADEAVVVSPGPLLRRGPGSPDTPPLAIYAVDRREGRCAVMVMMGDTDDVRPLPELSAEDHRLMPAEQP